MFNYNVQPFGRKGSSKNNSETKPLLGVSKDFWDLYHALPERADSDMAHRLWCHATDCRSLSV